MDSQDYTNIQRVLRTTAEELGCPDWLIKHVIQQNIDRSWEAAKSDPEARARWDEYFPNGKPTPEEYILLLGHALEKREEVPNFFCE